MSDPPDPLDEGKRSYNEQAERAERIASRLRNLDLADRLRVLAAEWRKRASKSRRP